MRALSLTQPWATLMALDAKRYETRDWATAVRGEVAIAASKSFPPDERRLCHDEPYRTTLIDAGFYMVCASPRVEKPSPPYLPLGVIVAVVDLIDCIATAPEGAPRRLSRAPSVSPAKHEESFGNYSPGRYAFITRNARRLAKPVPVERVERGEVRPGGALGFYQLSPACEAAVRAQIGLAG